MSQRNQQKIQIHEYFLPVTAGHFLLDIIFIYDMNKSSVSNRAEGKCHVQLGVSFSLWFMLLKMYLRTKNNGYLSKKTGLLTYQMCNHKHDHSKIIIQTMQIHRQKETSSFKLIPMLPEMALRAQAGIGSRSGVRRIEGAVQLPLAELLYRTP